MKQNNPALTNGELAVMRALWARGVLSARQIREELYPERTTSNHGTVQKFLQRLEAKGFVSRDRTHFMHLFEATLSQSEYAGAQLEALAEKLTEGSIVPFISHLVETKQLSSKERKEISELLRRRKK